MYKILHQENLPEPNQRFILEYEAKQLYPILILQQLRLKIHLPFVLPNIFSRLLYLFGLMRRMKMKQLGLAYFIINLEWFIFLIYVSPRKLCSYKDTSKERNRNHKIIAIGRYDSIGKQSCANQFK